MSPRSQRAFLPRRAVVGCAHGAVLGACRPGVRSASISCHQGDDHALSLLQDWRTVDRAGWDSIACG